ncbi:MAG: winged helix-turn-helix domain-containing protein [Acidimicrobiia bacterium]|nr:winged helix-turn-helix domain-containing protein [Acidimicrobiia bacterium]
MADHETSTHESPDYALADRLDLTPAQLRELMQPTRLEIIDLLTERAATTSQLADTLEKPKGTIGHHCKRLVAAGLIQVVRTRRVRALEAKYYGRTARLFLLGDTKKAGVDNDPSLSRPIDEINAVMHDPDLAARPGMTTARYARIPADRAQEWIDRLAALGDEFAGQARDGTTTYGVFLSVFPTTRKSLGS